MATVYAWDAASNLVGEGGTDDPSTSRSGDAYAVARTVDAANELVTVVKDPVGTRGGKVETTQFSYDGRGNRTGSVTTTKTGKNTHVESRSSFSYDGMDQLTSTSGPQGSASWVRDGMGRAVTVKEDGVTSTRLYDGVQVVAEGDTQLTLAPNGQTLSETTTTWTIGGKGKCRTGVSVESVDILTDVLGSAVGTASDGVISKDLALYGDFGEALTTPEVDTVTGFTGKVTTAGLVEFATRTYDPASRVWVQDDRYRGTTTRAASMNRYAYVEGAPESFVDVLGFYRAAAALQAQKLAALNAQLQSALASLGGLYGDALKYGANLTVAQMLAIYDHLNSGLDPAVKAALDPIVRQLAMQVKDIHAAQKLEQMIQQHNREVAQRLIEEYRHAQWVAQEKARVRAAEQARTDAYNKSQDRGYLGGLVDTLSIAGWGAANVGIGILNTPSAIVNSFGCFYEITCDKYQTRWGEVTVPNEAAWGTIDAVGPSEYKWWQSDRGTDIGVLLIMVGTAKAGEKWGPNAVAAEARAAQLRAEFSAQSRGVSATLSEQAQISHGHISAVPKAPYETGGYFTSVDDARAVLAAYQNGSAEIVGLSSNGYVVVRVPTVTGYNQNVGSKYFNQPTDTFLIKGTTKVTVVPTTPGGPSDMSIVFVDISDLAALAAEANMA